ncbi:MAG: hypothetical protein ACYC4R_14480 [Anaerolineae bacterium]
MTKELYVDKHDGTFADPLTAFGLAVVMRDLLTRAHDQAATVTLCDAGSRYRLELNLPLDDAALGRLQGPYMPIHVIQTMKNAAGLPTDLPAAERIDYEMWKERRQRYFEIRKTLSKEDRQALARGEAHPAAEMLRGTEPHGDWDILRAINPAALPGYNALVLQWWQVQDHLAEVVLLLRSLYGAYPNDLEEAARRWKNLAKLHGWESKAEAGALQLLNPSQGKGQNRQKPDRLAMDNMSGFWLVEWLKAVGLYRAAITKQLAGTKDRKTYVLCPVDLGLAEHEAVFGAFKQAMTISESAVRSDILASLRYARLLLGHALSTEGASVRARFIGGHGPRDVVSGFASAFYKNLGNSAATMNLPFVGLPGWLRVTSLDEVTELVDLVEEHEGLVRTFDESHGDDYELLLRYRDFCSGDDLDAFFSFTNAYCGWLMGRRERNQFARQLSEENIRRLIMANDERKLTPILETEGFRNIAYAIRQSTVTAQYLRNVKKDRRYDVRYGLGQELVRKAHYPKDFIAALGTFMHEYNAESAQVMENRPGPYRRSLLTSDIEEIVRLIDAYGSETVCSLLVAYGYARGPKREDAVEEIGASAEADAGEDILPDVESHMGLDDADTDE